MAENDTIRKTIITKTIGRKINTAPYETLEIGTSIQQEIEWKTKDELWKKSEALDQYVLADFEKAQNTWLQGLGMSSTQGTTPKSQLPVGTSNADAYDQLS